MEDVRKNTVPMLITLTKRQKEILAFLRKYQREQGVMPSTRDIQAHFGFSSQTAAVSHLRALERKGVLQKHPNKARAIVLANGPRDFSRELREIPVHGTIPAGLAADQQQEKGGCLVVDLEALDLPRNARIFALKVRGDSMINAHIVSGDFVVMEFREPKPGDVVAALIDGETTLKRYVVKYGKPYLKAENPDYPDLMPAMELVIQGVMVGLVRKAVPDRSSSRSRN
jgi:repressor LexA